GGPVSSCSRKSPERYRLMKAPIAITMLSLGVWITGCGQQTGDDVGGAIESGGAAVSDAASDAGQSTSDAMTDAGQAASEGAASAQESAGQTVEAAKVVTDDARAAVDDARTQATEGMAGLVDKARSTLEGVEGGPAMLQNVTAYIEKAKEALSSITDKESAEAAVGKLGELEGSL